MNKKQFKKLAAKIAVVLLIITCITTLSPGGTACAQTSGEFSVTAVIPENQVDTKQTYFDLRMKPGQSQTVQIVVTNSKSEDLPVRVQLNAASTGRNGLIVYTEPDMRDETMQVSITDVAALGAQTVTVPASGTATVDINIQMPDQEFDGVILGGIVVTKEDTDDTAANQGVSLQNDISYVIGLKLTENDNPVAPDFNLAAITPSLVNYKTAVVATLQNKVPVIAKEMNVKAQVYRSGSDTVLNELNLEAAEMAPQSKGEFVIDWGSQELQAGTYRLLMTADYEGQTWKWDEEFTIAGEANQLNKAAVGIQKNYTWLYLVIGLAALITIGVIAYWLGKRRVRDEK